jgi:YidC/Oxa1 family membrane protein insertase
MSSCRHGDRLPEPEDPMSDFFDSILRPLELVVAYLMVGFHTAFTAVGLPAASGWTWALSIVGLVVVIRILLIPLFVKQIKASRGLQLIQPQMKKIQEKYKGRTDPESRQAQSQEMMGLYRETGTNPFASCLPILLQSPVFFALFRVLNGIGKNHTIGPLNAELVGQAKAASLFGAQLSDTFLSAETVATQILTVVLVVLMSASTFTTQRQLMMKNMPQAALESPFAQQQKILLYVLPLVFAVSGVNFPIGVLIYWLTTNVWTMGQQFYVIRRMPAPGSLAEQALRERRRRRGKDEPGSGLDGSEGGGPAGLDGSGGPGGGSGGQRQQPKRQPRSKRTPPPGGGVPLSKGPRPGSGAEDGETGPDGAGPQERGTGPEERGTGPEERGTGPDERGTGPDDGEPGEPKAGGGREPKGSNGTARPTGGAGRRPRKPPRTPSGQRPGRPSRPSS